MKKVLLASLALMISAAVGTTLWFYLFCITPVRSSTAPVLVDIPPGSNFRAAARLLREKAVVSNAVLFTLLARLKRSAHAIKPGEYRFADPLSPLQVLDVLIRGDVVVYAVTIPEGSTIFDIAKIFEEAGLGTAQDYIAKASDAMLIASLGIDAQSLEGFLFPDTYRFEKGSSPETTLKRMFRRFNEILSQVLESKTIQMPLTNKDIVILASMIEKESSVADEKPLIAAVFLNRLRRNMRLECDPTVLYGIRRDDPGFQGRLKKEHLRQETPYNTYRIMGLPAGPICNPGRDSLQAVLNPAQVDYLYFVSRNDGTHQFSYTLPEHNSAVDRYQKDR